MPGRNWVTPEIAEWLREHYDGRLVVETAAELNRVFGTQVSARQVQKANVYWKFGRAKKRPGPPTEARFKKGHQPVGTLPMYGERWKVVNGKRVARLIKVPPDASRAGYNRGRFRWVRKAVWVWEQVHGPVPKGHAILQLDGDPANCAIDNLECVRRSLFPFLNSATAAPYAGPEWNAVRVRTAQLRQAIAEAEA